MLARSDWSLPQLFTCFRIDTRYHPTRRQHAPDSAPTIAEIIGKQVQVYLKYDGLNPTGSFKDRGMTMAISKAKEEGSKAVICASTGNTSAAAAAYARRAGMKAFVLIPDGYVALGKLAQALLYGAEVLAIKGNFDKCP